MARFRDNTRQIVIEPIYRRQGLKIDRVRRFDETVRLPDRETWLSWSFQITLNGTRFVRYGERSYTLGPSTIFWTSPIEAPVQTHALAGTRSDTIILTFSLQRWRLLGEHDPIFRTGNAALLMTYPQQPILSLQLASPQLLYILRRLLAASEHTLPAHVIDNFVELLVRLIAEIRFEERYQRHDHEQRRRVEAAQARINASFTQPPSLQELAGQLNVSPRQLQRDFIACTGLTPVKYRNIIRLSEANELLAETSVPIATIAAHLGYPSVSHFSAAFRQLYHCSPRQMREAPSLDRIALWDASAEPDPAGIVEDSGTPA